VPASIGQGQPQATASAARLSPGEAAQLRRDDLGLYVAFCPADEQAAVIASRPRAVVAMADHEGWPQDQCLKMDKGPPGLSHTLVGLEHVHNWLLGGYGNDTIYAGDAGDVIWGDYQPEGQPESQRDYIHGGAGEDWIYSSHGYNEIWTGAGNDHLALPAPEPSLEADRLLAQSDRPLPRLNAGSHARVAAVCPSIASMRAAMPATVNFSNSDASETSAPSSRSTSMSRRRASSEWPPSAKKSS
jgi:hypothetical protein